MRAEAKAGVSGESGEKRAMIRIGPAGWSYKDWEGIVYPPDPPKGFHRAAYLAQFFDTIEINSSFYGPPAPAAVRGWVQRVSGNPGFKFTAKLWRGFTHERNTTQQDEVAVKNGLDVMAGAGRLGALLLQFPWSFKFTPENGDYVAELQRRFREYPLVLEVRHISWNDRHALDMLAELGIGFCNIDQPLIGRSLRPSAEATSRVGYVRLHGRNYKNWFTENQTVNERYDYLYSPKELEPWVDRIRTVTRHAKDTYIVTNNHNLGKAVVNALELEAFLRGGPVKVPEQLVAKYPELRQVAEVPDGRVNIVRT
jgi:uncharacterized protein YecE (DUF72 family)